MSDQPPLDIGAFFAEQQKKKEKTKKTKTRTQQKTQQDQRRADEESKATKSGDFMSSDEDENKGHIEIVAGKVKDIKEVNKEKQLAKDAQREQEFKWDLGGGMSQQPAVATTTPQQPTAKDTGTIKDFKGTLKDNQKKTDGFAKEGITFGKKPQFKKSEHVGNKGDFPELGDEHKQLDAS